MVYKWLDRLPGSLLNPLLAAVCPPRCLVCGEPVSPGQELCPGCTADLPANHHACPHCALPLPPASSPGSTCGRCQRRLPTFDHCVAPLLYQSPVNRLITGLKFHQRLAASRLLAELLLTELRERPAPLPELILPVPLHRGRLRERGFNQALELARPLGEALGIAVDSRRLRRIRATPHQLGLDRRERRRNLRGAFQWRGPDCPAHVALVDDVLTTGSTAEEIARLLKRHGAKRVELWTVARTPRGAGPQANR